MELVFAGSIFYNVYIPFKLGVVCHADFRQAEYDPLPAEALS